MKLPQDSSLARPIHEDKPQGKKEGFAGEKEVELDVETEIREEGPAHTQGSKITITR